MSTAFAWQSIFEVILFIAIVGGLFFEDKIAEWERSMLRKLKKAVLCFLHRMDYIKRGA